MTEPQEPMTKGLSEILDTAITEARNLTLGTVLDILRFTRSINGTLSEAIRSVEHFEKMIKREDERSNPKGDFPHG